VAELRATERLYLLESHVQLLNYHLERNVEAGIAQDVVNAVHYEVFQSLFVLIAKFVAQVSVLEAFVLLMGSCEALDDLSMALYHEILKVTEDLEPGPHALLAIQVIRLANAASFAQDSIKLND